ncbi:MAG: hypothetical protein HN390_13975 [Anaerolineae bacterium]|jgi:hypothetical protein|nr:hypothetical protein [Anaerolineae bacterium]MBT7191236.1 hypothetical protein [Anaerolineae bacterium]
MKKNITILLALIFSLLSFSAANAQTGESIWLDADTIAYKTEEIVIVRVNAASTTPIQGFTFQIRYDPACLKPISASSPISGMNGLQLPQSSGLVDASFASTTPQSALGVIAEASFMTLGGCNTELYLENAALAIRNAEGFAAQLPGITIGNRNISLVVDSAIGNSQTQAPVGEQALSLEPSDSSSETDWPAIIAFSLLVLVIGSVVAVILFILYKQVKTG